MSEIVFQNCAKIYNYIINEYGFTPDKYEREDAVFGIYKHVKEGYDLQDAILEIFSTVHPEIDLSDSVITAAIAINKKINPITFASGMEMLDYLMNGNDLFNPITGQYIFLYNDRNSICCYTLNKDEVNDIAAQAVENNEYWGAYLGVGGSIYDEDKDTTNLDLCNDVFQDGLWLNTTDYEKTINLVRMDKLVEGGISNDEQ